MSTIFNDGDLKIKQEICNALGLDVGFVNSITIKIVPDDVIRIETVLFLEKTQGGKLVKVIKKFHWVEDKK